MLPAPMPELHDQAVMDTPPAQPAAHAKFPGGRMRFTKENAREMWARGMAARRAKARLVPLPQPTGEISPIDSALLDNVRVQLARVHQKIMNSTCGAQAMARYAAAETKLIELHNAIMDRVNSQKPPAQVTPAQTSDFRPGAVSKSVAAAK